MIYDVGDGIELRHTVRDPDRALVAATVSLAITKPDGTTVAPFVTATALGIYDAAMVTIDQAGIWAYEWTVSGAVVDVVPGTFTVADPAPPAYTDLAIVKSGLGKLSTDDRDDLIESAITASARMIDARTGRRFYLDSTTSPRVYSRAGSGRVHFDRQLLAYVISTDDIGSAAGLTVEVGSSVSGVWNAVTDYTTGPENAVTRGRPITTLYMPYGWEPSLWTWELRVTARWGWPSAPAQISEANRMLAARLYRRKDSPQGVVGSAEWGMVRVSRFDPDVESLIGPYVLPGFA
jgi:hypothetical protein